MRSKKQILKSIVLIILGSTILSFGSYNFNYQNSVTEGGVLGLILLIKNVFDISPSITSLMIDLSLFALGSKFFGKKFLLYSMLSTASFSTTYKIWENIGFLVPSFQNNMLIASILAGIGVGIGVGLVVRGGGAAGGDDVIALLGNKFTKFKVNHIYLFTDAVVLIMSLVYLDIKQVFFSIIAVSISGKLISMLYNENDESENNDKDDEYTEESLMI
ncbi:YitT family protein [Romboutsia lituseburensis]|uniref:YitT family protein n=1 Tax=Romboutsia lituseburensis TaxID=1537 RepID=UPI00215A4EDF|nr:YitT family protein [Romboutsia lituseburensis]MCR8745027.1 YitT family protein [Romboutsia lituseburensis]